MSQRVNKSYKQLISVTDSYEVLQTVTKCYIELRSVTDSYKVLKKLPSVT